MKQIDARGIACPGPVVHTKKFLDENYLCKNIQVIVDNRAAVENLSRFLESCGFQVKSEEREAFYIVTGTREEGFLQDEIEDFDFNEEKKDLFLISSEFMGSGDISLGSRLMCNFIYTLNEYQGLWKLVFLNSGVKLTAKGSCVIDELKKIEKSGVKILVCGTCLEFYNLLDYKEVGETTNMLDIVTSINLADKVVSL